MDAYDIARFWSKVDVKARRECWPWKAAINDSGYGEFKLSTEDGRAGAHRIAYALFAGVEPTNMIGLVIRHKCDRPSCCNPFHLESGTHSDNVRDRVERERSALGNQNGRHVLTEDQIPAIRADGRPLKTIAEAYGVTHWTIQAVKYRRSWRHVP